MDITGVSNERARRPGEEEISPRIPLHSANVGIASSAGGRQAYCYPTAGALTEKLARTVGRLDGQWAYHLANGEELFRVIRFYTSAGKTFRLIHRQPAGWLPGPDEPPGGLGLFPLFHLPHISSASRVFVVEGEKAAEALSALPDLVASTSALGPESPFRSDWSPLAGKEVIILPDHDAAGSAYTNLVLEQLARLIPRPTVKIVTLEMIWNTDVPISDGYDVVDWLQCGAPPAWTPAVRSRVLANAANAAPLVKFFERQNTDNVPEGEAIPESAPGLCPPRPDGERVPEGGARARPASGATNATSVGRPPGPARHQGPEKGTGPSPQPSPTGRGSQFGLKAEPAALLATAEVLLRISARARFFPGDDDRFYAEIAVGDHEETHELRSPSFRRWLIREYRKETHRFVPVEALNSLIASLEADAEDTGLMRNVYLRVGGDLEGSALYVDLGDPTRRAVVITPGGWEIIDRPGVTFRRPKGMRPLPAPIGGGSLDLLKQYVNLDDDEFLLLIGWLAAALRPTGPYPIIVLSGEQGSAKTTLARLIRKLIDPHVSPLAADPREPRDLMAAAQGCWALALDNISTVPPWLSDYLCRLATGGGLHVRKLYSNDEASFLDAMRPVILNGIDDFVRRGDLSDRSLYLHPPTIADENRRLERTLMAGFDRDHPLIFGALLTAVANGLRMEPHVNLPRLPRMADFAHFAESVCQGLGHAPGVFLAAYNRNRQIATEAVLDDSPMARPLREFLGESPSWTGTASELLDQLTAIAGEKALAARAWPRTPKGLSSILRRIAPQLRATGLVVTFDRDQYTRTITLTRPADAKADGPN